MPKTSRSLFLAYLALGVSVLSLGFSPIFVRWANAPGIVASFYRVGIAALVMALPFYRRIRKGAELPLWAIRIAVFGGLVFAGDIAFWATGVMLSGATNPTLLANVAPLWVGLGALLLFHEKLNAKFWAGLLLAIAGAAVVLGFDTLRGTTLGLGTFFGLLSSIFYGSYFLITQRGRETLDSLTYFWLSATGSTVALLFLALAFQQPLIGYPPPTYLNFIAMGLINQVLGYLAMNYALGHLPATLVSATSLGQPVVTAILAGPLLGESIRAWQVVGGLAVLIGVYLVHRSQNRAQ
jgi:drug/metabolite transporter (DMT)-like permease